MFQPPSLYNIISCCSQYAVSSVHSVRPSATIRVGTTAVSKCRPYFGNLHPPPPCRLSTWGDENFCRATAACQCGPCRRTVSVRLSVRPSVTFVYCIETSKHVLKLFWLSGKPTILVFLYQTLRQYSDGDPHNWSKKCDFASVDVGFISQRVRRKEENLTARIGTSEAEVTNNKRLLSRYCTVEANYRQTVAPPLGDSIWNHKLNVARGVCPEGRGVTQVASTDVCSKNRHPWLRHGSCWEIKIDK